MRDSSRRLFPVMAFVLGTALAAAWTQRGGAGPALNVYAGAGNCKECHAAENQGSPHAKWLASAHSKAFEKLASEQALRIAREKKMGNPQTDPDCLSCHVTAAGVPKEQKMGAFDPALGVQCESCHGPGYKHIEARLAIQNQPPGVVQQIPAGEIGHPDEANCVQCHNAKSPTHKPFDYKARLKDVAHLDPRRNRPQDYLEQWAERTAKRK